MNKFDARLSNSKEGFQTRVWGPPLWMFLHIISLNYTPNKKAAYKRFFISLKGILPCGACRTNYKRILQTVLPLDDYVFSCRESLAMWVFLLHNQVQKDIFNTTKYLHDMPVYKDTKADFFKAMEFYETFRAQCTKNSYGCVIPVKGTRKQSKIKIVKYVTPKKSV